ncbi:DUF4433 domain-containing protein [Variovorax sp. RCC_210]|uniref:type II toxin-antitoxin system toxin DNA ADP-ribosyl transferase DarT n=1 Tax=Variovorax sp. RCC_210 TaxID=3239217 RepID=UPI003524AA3B
MHNYTSLNAEKALIWRIVHRDNLQWLLMHGLHCRSSAEQDPDYVDIGNSELIDKRAHRVVPVAPGGSLIDYVPFYFTPFSVMMMNIRSGRSVTQRANEEIVMLVSSLHRVHEMGIPILFTDAHAYPPATRFFNDLNSLGEIDWPILQARDFKRDLDDPRKLERYQAEALVYRHLPVHGLLGIVCYTDALKLEIETKIAELGLQLPVHVRTGWYF